MSIVTAAMSPRSAPGECDGGRLELQLRDPLALESEEHRVGQQALVQVEPRERLGRRRRSRWMRRGGRPRRTRRPARALPGGMAAPGTSARSSAPLGDCSTRSRSASARARYWRRPARCSRFACPGGRNSRHDGGVTKIVAIVAASATSVTMSAGHVTVEQGEHDEQRLDEHAEVREQP